MNVKIEKEAPKVTKGIPQLEVDVHGDVDVYAAPEVYLRLVALTNYPATIRTKLGRVRMSPREARALAEHLRNAADEAERVLETAVVIR